jgi:hypothetical protein
MALGYTILMPRPSVMTEEVVRKLTEASKLDVSVEEACLYAGISKDTYYRKLKEDDEFSDEMERARMYATMTARLCVVRAIATDPHLAFRYLERKRREEFSSCYHPEPEVPAINLGAEATARLQKYLVPPHLALKIAA